jgi:hypothetical protein
VTVAGRPGLRDARCGRLTPDILELGVHEAGLVGEEGCVSHDLSVVLRLGAAHREDALVFSVEVPQMTA